MRVSHTILATALLSALPMFPAGAENISHPVSSFSGLNFDINGVRVDLPVVESLRLANPNVRIKKGHWKDSQGHKARVDTVNQNYASGHIRSVRETIKVTVTPWHSGNFIQHITRKVSIRTDNQKPTVADFVAATKAKYGEPSQTVEQGVFGRRAIQLQYIIKDGKVTTAPCHKVDEIWFNPRAGIEERALKFETLLAQTQTNDCDAILSVFYTTDFRNKGRIVDYGASARDFRLEFQSFLTDVKERDAATKARQVTTPKGSPKL